MECSQVSELSAVETKQSAFKRSTFSFRTVRKALVVSTYEEFHRKGREKLGLGKVEPIRVVLESDGTQVMTTLN